MSDSMNARMVGTIVGSMRSLVDDDDDDDDSLGFALSHRQAGKAR